MRIFGVEIKRVAKALNPVSGIRNGWRIISEPFAGAWQRNIEEEHGTLLCYPTLYACLNRIASDIGKMPAFLKAVDENGIWTRSPNSAYDPVLRRPNHYQTWQQFIECWVLSKLISGNTYVLKLRDSRGVVRALYVLDPSRVMPCVSDSGDVFYELNYATTANLLPESYGGDRLRVPAPEIIHDRMNCFHHPLIGIPPLCAAHWPALKNMKILRSSSEFFANNAQPGGLLTAPAGMTDADAKTVRDYWQENYSGSNTGRVAVIGADMKFTSFAMKGADSQLVEQMRYSDEQICQPFGIPPFVVGIGTMPAGLKADDIANMYHNLALQSHVESIENLLDDGLGISRPLGVELDINVLIRMDTEKRGAVMGGLVKDGIATPNEARREFDYKPLEGGDTVYMQQQDFPLDQVRLNKIEQPKPEPQPPSDPPDPDMTDKALAQLWKRSPETLTHA